MEASEAPNIQTMGGCMLAGDLAISKLKPSAILLTGDTRQGKSTLFNYILNIPLTATYSNEFYEVVFEPSPSSVKIPAEMKATFESVTLVPNIDSILVQGKQVSLIDAAGFMDENRSFVGKFGVWFMFERIIEKVNSIRFVFTVNKSHFQMNKFEEFINPYLSFVDVLVLDKLLQNPVKLNKFINSISIVVSRANNKKEYYLGKMNKILSNLPKTLPPSKQMLVHIFKSVVENERLQIFKQAEVGKYPEPCTIIQSLIDYKKNWNQYSFEKQFPKDWIFQLKFQKELAAMTDSEKSQYHNYTELKAKTLKKSTTQIKWLLQKGLEYLLCPQKVPDFQQQFIELNKISENHPYGNLLTMQKYLKLQFNIENGSIKKFNPSEFLSALEHIADVCENLHQRSDLLMQMSVGEKIGFFGSALKEVLRVCFRVFCELRVEEEFFVAFMCVNARIIEEEVMQLKIDKNKQQKCQIHFLLQNFFESLLPKPLHLIFLQYLVKFPDLESSLSKHLEAHIQKNLPYLEHMSPDLLASFYKRRINSLVIECGQQFKLANYDAVLSKVMKVFAGIKKLRNGILEKNPKSIAEQEKEEIAYCRFKKTQVLKIAAQCLQKKGKFRVAIKIYEHINAYHLLSKFYERRISYQKNPQKKHDLLLEYCDLLRLQGKGQQLRTILQQLIDQFEYLVQDRIQHMKQILSLCSTLFPAKQYTSRLLDEIKDQKFGREAEEEEILEEIRDINQYYIDGEDRKQEQQEQGQGEGQEKAGEEEVDRDMLFRDRNFGKAQENDD